MIVARSLAEAAFERNSVVTVGTFDGVHRGHVAIFRELISRAKARAARSVVVTFDPHPKEVVGTAPVFLLASLEERLTGFRALGVDVALVIRFTYEFSRQSSREFFERFIIGGVGVSEVIVGHDHMFGRDREAGFVELQSMGAEAGFTSTAVDAVTVEGKIVSSSAIRALLGDGNVAEAANLLGRNYAVRGAVVRGDGRGRELGVPTANIEPEFARKLVPANGVYVVRVVLPGGEKPFGMLNIGVRPTFEAALGRRAMEAHLFDFDGDLYGQSVEVQFLKRLRDEQKFSSAQELVSQLQKDRSESLAVIAAQSTVHASS
jgi:riboflavin kinase/FMN adenylyltransferase